MMIDLFFAIVAGYGFFLGFTKGIISTVFTILSYLFGLLAAFKLSPAVTRFLETAMSSQHPMLFIAGFAIAFFGTMFLVRFIAKALSSGLRSANINVVNQAAGGILLAAIMTWLYSLMLWFGVQSHIVKDSTIRDSMTYPYLKNYPTLAWNAFGKLRPTLLEFWDNSIDFMDRVEKVGVEKSEDDINIYDIEESDDAAEDENIDIEDETTRY